MGKTNQPQPKLLMVIGGAGSGRSTFIAAQLAPQHPEAVIVDADQLWLKLPEYAALEQADWSTAGDRTYAEVRWLRDAVLAEAAARGLDIILETRAPGADEVITIFGRGDYKVSASILDQKRLGMHRTGSFLTTQYRKQCATARIELLNALSH